MHEAKLKIRKISVILAAILKNANISNCSRVRCPYRAGYYYRDPRGTLYAEKKNYYWHFSLELKYPLWLPDYSIAKSL